MIIELKDISKAVNGRPVLKEINWHIGSEDTWLLTGAAGSGKTLLLRIVLGLEKADSGSVNLLGDYKYASVNAGVVFQEDRLCGQFSAVENVAMVNERLSEMVAEEELGKFLKEEELYVPVSSLDPVTRRIVVIIRACIIPSDVLLMDEPFRGMEEGLTPISGTRPGTRASYLPSAAGKGWNSAAGLTSAAELKGDAGRTGVPAGAPSADFTKLGPASAERCFRQRLPLF